MPAQKRKCLVRSTGPSTGQDLFSYALDLQWARGSTLWAQSNLGHLAEPPPGHDNICAHTMRAVEPREPVTKHERMRVRATIKPDVPRAFVPIADLPARTRESADPKGGPALTEAWRAGYLNR